MATEKQATRTPYTYTPHASQLAPNVAGGYIEGDGKLICDMNVTVRHKLGKPTNVDATAAFILRACNNHDALLKALNASDDALNAVCAWMAQNCQGIDGAAIMGAMIQVQHAANVKVTARPLRGNDQ